MAVRKIEEAIESCGGVVDVAVMHGPPDNVGTIHGKAEGVGFDSFEMTMALMKAKPKVVFAGHLHPDDAWIDAAQIDDGKHRGSYVMIGGHGERSR